MAGFVVLSVDPGKFQGDFLQTLFWQTFYHQHLGQDYAGLTTFSEGRPSEERIRLRTHRGLFRPTFTDDLAGLEGTEGIGYCGDGREPISVDSKMGEFSICFVGNICNREDLVAELKAAGHSFAWGGKDVEVVAKLIAQGSDYVDGIQEMTGKIEGAYTIALLSSDGIFIASDPSGRWPPIIGEKEGATVVALDPCGFENFGFKRLRDVNPGEIVRLESGRLETKAMMLGGRTQICHFLPVYTNFPNATIRGIPGSLVRKRLGAVLARRDIERGFIPDIVTYVADSGKFPGIGYHQEFCRQVNQQLACGGTELRRIPFLDELLHKYTYSNRSYSQQNQESRDLEAHTKQLVSSEDYSGLVIVVCDDSIRRATQIHKTLVPKLKSLGVKAIHVRIANPESFSHCPWGKTVQKGEMIAARIASRAERAKFLGVDSLEHATIEELAEAIGLPLEMLCVDCDLKPPSQ